VRVVKTQVCALLAVRRFLGDLFDGAFVVVVAKMADNTQPHCQGKIVISETRQRDSTSNQNVKSWI
jgi:hypothetical protein